MTLLLMNFAWLHVWTTGGDLLAELEWCVLGKSSSGLQSQHRSWQPSIPSRESIVIFVPEQLRVDLWCVVCVWHPSGVVQIWTVCFLRFVEGPFLCIRPMDDCKRFALVSYP